MSSILHLCRAAALWALLAAPASAALFVPLPHEGRWDCTLDGREITITWERVLGSEQTCRGSYCTIRPTSRIVGWLRETERGGDWEALSDHDFDPRSDRMTFKYRGASWTVWGTEFEDFLVGHSTWRGRPFPLSCTRAAASADRRFASPGINGRRLDWCRVWSRECGKPAADQYCRDRGYWRSRGHGLDADIGATQPTVTIGDGRVCTRAFCDGFRHVECDAG